MSTDHVDITGSVFGVGGGAPFVPLKAAQWSMKSVETPGCSAELLHRGAQRAKSTRDFVGPTAVKIQRRRRLPPAAKLTSCLVLL